MVLLTYTVSNHCQHKQDRSFQSLAEVRVHKTMSFPYGSLVVVQSFQYRIFRFRPNK